MKKFTIKEVKERAASMSLLDACRWLDSIKGDYGLSVKKIADKYRRKLDKYNLEVKRLTLMSRYEKEAYNQGYSFIGGVDEAGRGPLAGPVVAACVILPKGIFLEKLNDSKKLSSRIRDKLFDEISMKAVSYGIGIVDEKYIDEYNILNATKKAMEVAIKNTNPKPELIIIDALKLENVAIPQWQLIRGDSLSISVAAASIMAKVTRDRIIKEADLKYPQYGFAKNKGYGTQEHRNAIKKYGLSPIHRRSFTKNLV